MSKITDKEIEELRKRAENRSLDFGMGARLVAAKPRSLRRRKPNESSG
jgi:hypothetical protein